MKILKKVGKTTMFIGIFVILVISGLYIYAAITPKVEMKTVSSFNFYDKDEKLFFSGNKSNEWVKLKDVSTDAINATIAVEDKNFYKHNGFDYLRIIKAMGTNVKNKKISQGASTITQQYARNLYLTMEKTWKRKFDEALLTFEFETHYSKNEILEGYLNTINYGQGVYGLENAAQYYFGKSAKELNLAEGSMLAGIPNSPANYSPLVDEYSAKKRQLTVLSMMVKNEYITEDEKEAAYNTELTYLGSKEKNNLVTLMYYQDAVMKELESIVEIPKSLLEVGGLKIYTAFDMNAQSNFEENMIKTMKDYPDNQMAGVMMNPNNGEIISLIGGTNYIKSQYNRAISSKRQVGSAMKPFLYYAALENGFTSSTTFLSSPTTFTFGNNKTYSPKNYGDNYPEKEISLASAIVYSDNVYAVKTHMFLGEETLVDISKRVGIDEKLEANPSLPLGTNEINLVDFVGGYGAFANLGYKVEPHLIRKVEDMDGNVIYEKKILQDYVLNENNVFILNELLANTYSYDFVDYNTPTLLSIAPRLKNKFAVKSGTTDTDSVTVGYNKDIVVGVWYGNDDSKNISSSESKTTKIVWADTIEDYFTDKEATWYDIPETVVGVLTNPISGEIAAESDKKKHLLYYLKGTEPTSGISNKILEDTLPKDGN